MSTDNFTVNSIPSKEAILAKHNSTLATQKLSSARPSSTNSTSSLPATPIRSPTQLPTPLDLKHAELVVDLNASWDPVKLAKLKSDHPSSINPATGLPYTETASGLGSRPNLHLNNWGRSEFIAKAKGKPIQIGDCDSVTEDVISDQGVRRDRGWDMLDYCPITFLGKCTGTDPVNTYLSSIQIGLIEVFITEVLEWYARGSGCIMAAGSGAQAITTKCLLARKEAHQTAVSLAFNLKFNFATFTKTEQIKTQTMHVRFDNSLGALVIFVAGPSRFASFSAPISDKASDDIAYTIADSYSTPTQGDQFTRELDYFSSRRTAHNLPPTKLGAAFGMKVNKAAKAEREQVKKGGAVFGEDDLKASLRELYPMFGNYLNHNRAELDSIELLVHVEASGHKATLSTDLQRAQALISARRGATVEANNDLIKRKRKGEKLDEEDEQHVTEVEARRADDKKRRKTAGDKHAAENKGQRSTNAQLETAKNNRAANKAVYGTNLSPTAQKKQDDAKADRKAKTGKSSTASKLEAERKRQASMDKDKKRAEKVLGMASMFRKSLGLPSTGNNPRRPVEERVEDYKETRTKAMEKGRKRPLWWPEYRDVLIGRGGPKDLIGWE